jgi:CelD/BcsL family acetyltransferase involved in cellulose biosynthesis
MRSSRLDAWPLLPVNVYLRRPVKSLLPEGASPFAFPIETDDKPELLDRLQRHGIRALDFWAIPHRSLPSTGFPESARLRQRIVGLPVHQELRASDLERIVEVVKDGRDRQGELELQVTTALDTLRLEWSMLAERTRNVFATWEWISTWWHHFGRDRELLVTTCRSGPELMAILPLYVWSARPVRVLRFLGHGPSDELGPIDAAADQPSVAGAFRAALAQLDWDILLGEQLAAGKRWGTRLNARPVSREGNPVLRFGEGGWEGFLATRSSNFREQVRRRPRRLAREHHVRYRLVDGSRDLQEELDVLFHLHTLRWQGRSPFLTDALFHRSFAATAFQRGWLRLWFLEIDGRPAAALYGFRFAGTESYYQAGRDPSWDGYAPGFVLLAHAIRRAAEDGMSEYRLLRGGESYKYRFANMDAGVETIALSRGPVTGAAVRFLPTTLTARRVLRRASDRLIAVLPHQDDTALVQPWSSRRQEVR